MADRPRENLGTPSGGGSRGDSSILQKSEEGSPEERMTYFHNFLPTSLLLMRNNLKISKIEEGKKKTLKFATYIHLSIHTGSHGDFSEGSAQPKVGNITVLKTDIWSKRI